MNKFWQIFLLIFGLWLGLDLVSHLGAEVLWFQEVGYLPAFLLRIKTQLLLWIPAGITVVFFLGNLNLAHRFQHQSQDLVTFDYSSLNLSRKLAIGKLPLNLSKDRGKNKNLYPHKTDVSRDELEPSLLIALNLPLLLLVVLVLGLLVGLILINYGQVALTYWHLKSDLTPLKVGFQPEFIWLLGKQLSSQVWQGGLLLILAIIILIYPQFVLSAIAILISLCFGLIISAQWQKILPFIYPTSFNFSEPVFNRDVSFYIFKLPVWEIGEFWLFGLFLYTLVSVTLVYLLSANSLSQGRFPGFSPVQLQHLSGLCSCLMLSLALGYWLNRYELLYSRHGITYGASYTEVTVELPVYTILSILAAVLSIFLLTRTIFSQRRRGSFLSILGVYLVVAAIASGVLPAAVERFIVQPNELAREKPYIQRSIALTRKAFDLDKIDVQTFNPKGKLTATDLQKNDLTIDNIRLWDTRPLLATNRQLQQIRLYYKFPNADLDRYMLAVEGTGDGDKGAEGAKEVEEWGSRGEKVINYFSSQQPPVINPKLEKRQVILAARELDYSAVPEQAKTWVNKHLVYTHGYGFTVSPVNKVAPGGLPDYFVKDIGVDGAKGKNDTLWTANEQIRQSIPIENPRIYYGELTDNYVMTGTKVSEFDYPSGDDNVSNTYNGRGGIAIASLWQRLMFAKYLNDFQTAFTQNFTPETKLLFRRNIKERVRAIAPFLRYDSDPYLVVADTQVAEREEKQGSRGGKGVGEWGSRGEKAIITSPHNSQQSQNYLYWVIDAYTTSDHFPYSDASKDNFNYIRNSVKVVIDAYNGSVDFYVADTEDPIINTWTNIFPQLFKPLSAMPDVLRQHLRYPVDFFSIQSDRLLSYHMTDAQVFYNREDQWQIPTEIYADKPQSVEPYYLIMKLPTEQEEEFILLLPFTPSQRTNLIAWLAARSDGKEYGKLLLYEFPKQQLVYGTEQIEALINQDPEISRQISLWNRQGSRAIQGNLLVIPIERSLLYVEPLYLEAEQNSLPTLVRVIVVYENRIVMATNLQQALQAIFQAKEPVTPAIVRPVTSPDS